MLKRLAINQLLCFSVTLSGSKTKRLQQQLVLSCCVLAKYSVTMSSFQQLRDFIRQRLTAAAEEIFTQVEKTIFRYEEEIKLLEKCWKPQIKLTRIDEPKQHVTNTKDPELWVGQNLKKKPEPQKIRQNQQEPEPHCIGGKHDHIQIKDQKEPEFGETVIQYQEEIRKLDICWNQLTRTSMKFTRTDFPKQQVWKEEDVLNDQREPEPPQFTEEPENGPSDSDYLQCEEDQKNPEGLGVKVDEEDVDLPQFEDEPPEPPEFEDGEINSEFIDIKKDPEEPMKIKEDQEKLEPPEFEEKLENPEGLKVKADERDPEPPRIKVKQEEPEPPRSDGEHEQPEPEPPRSDGEHEQPEPEPPRSDGEHEKPQWLTFLIQSSQQIQQLLSTCETNAFMDPLPSDQPEPDKEQLHHQNRPELQHLFYSGATLDTEQITEERNGSEPPPVQQERKKLCSGWEAEQFMAAGSQEHGWIGPEPEPEQFQCQNPAEEQQTFIELKTIYSCDSEQMQEEPEPPRFQQQESVRSWEEKLLMASTCQQHGWFQPEPGAGPLHCQNSPEDHHRFMELYGFYSGVTPGQEQYGSEPVQQQQKSPDWEQQVTPTRPAAEDQNQEGTSSAGSERRSHTNTVKFSKCYVCSAVVKSQSLNQHLKTHPGVKPYVCKRCGERFAQHARLRDHKMAHLVDDLKARQLAGVKSRQKNFFCEICKRGFAELAFLKNHYKAHKWEQPFCETCGKHFTSEYSLKSHLKIHQRKRAKPFYCGLCKKRFACHSTKKSHMKRHKEQEPISYKTWRETSNTTKPLVSHRETSSAAETLFCRICKILFLYRTSYIAHMKSHKSPANKCCKCGKSFKDKQKLAAHRKSHKKKPTLNCSKCGKSFRDKSEVGAHMRSCGKLYGCEECGNRFSSWKGVRRHQKGGHCRGKVQSVN
ncbi:zinc finger protein 343-like isoform X1 [Xiphophorus couchianus]|uniref:zinc finger protein 343-like isoform X1 n=1 Tax=Xiphophorus couchianus TaxID=32473 RepID=UPI001015D7BE|nr:zinc finger protein 343-like isoform X1 [Xiphophorus couchianus]